MPSKVDVRWGDGISLPASDVSMKKNNSFYGRELPRPALIGDPTRSLLDVSKDQRRRSGFTPVTRALMEWSTKAPVRMGGTHPVWSGAHPRRPLTPFRAFLATKLLELEDSDPSLKLMPYVEQMKVLVRVSTGEWKAIMASSAAKYEALSKVDENRYAMDLVKYEKRNPGYSACVAAVLHEDPELADAEPKERSAALRKVRLAAVRAWRKLDAAATQLFESTATEAMAQYEVEVAAYAEEHPRYPSWLAASTKRAAAAAKAKRKAKQGAKGGKGFQSGGKAGKTKTPANTVEAEDSSDDDDEPDLSSEDEAGSDAEDRELEQMLLDASRAAPRATRKRGLAALATAAQQQQSTKGAKKSRTADEPAPKASAAREARGSVDKAAPTVKASSAMASSAKAVKVSVKAAVTGKTKKLKPHPAVHASEVASAVALGAGGPPAEPASLVHADVLKLFFTDVAKQNVEAFKGVVTEYSVIDGIVCWLVKYEDNDEEDVEWSELKPLLAQAAAAAATVAEAGKKGMAVEPRSVLKRKAMQSAAKGINAMAGSGESVTVLASAARPKSIAPSSVKRGKKGVAASKSKALQPQKAFTKRGSSRKSSCPAQAAA